MTTGWGKEIKLNLHKQQQFIKAETCVCFSLFFGGTMGALRFGGIHFSLHDLRWTKKKNCFRAFLLCKWFSSYFSAVAPRGPACLWPVLVQSKDLTTRPSWKGFLPLWTLVLYMHHLFVPEPKSPPFLSFLFADKESSRLRYLHRVWSQDEGEEGGGLRLLYWG